VSVAPQDVLRSVQFLKGVGPGRARLLERLGIRTVEDLLRHLPTRYYDRRSMTPLRELRRGAAAVVEADVVAVRGWKTARRGVPIVEVTVRDGSGEAALVWFNQPFREREFKPGDRVVAAGKVQPGPGPRLVVEEHEILGDGRTPVHAKGMVPSYPATAGLTPRQIRGLVRLALDSDGAAAAESLPASVLSKRGLPALAAALWQVHAPASPEEAERARRRFAYEEFFRLQVELALRRRGIRREDAARRIVVSEALDFRIRTRFPFRLTGAQERAVRQIRKDLAAGPPMNRLLQGDVGSGKTLVAAYALLAAVGTRHQAALMAPTEILAEQHCRTFRALLGPDAKVRLAFLGGGLKRTERTETIRKIAAGEVDLVIGTHAIVEEGVKFRNLAVAVIDEQQKFGVLQRARLGRKGERPHVLVMTATPIPRTLALTLYGDLDLTVIDEMPPGRIPATTLYAPPSGRADKLEFIRRKLREGRQAYFVYPLVDDSDRVALASAIASAGELSELYPEYEVALLHGRMKAEEKARAMEAFRSGRAKILVSTLVIEVGIDVPNATILVIDHCERYGLAQLHQLRGRIGRGGQESTCILFGKRNDRIDAFVATSDGFRIAEADLRLRGPGDLLGTRQSGLPELRAARLLEDAVLLEQAREDAFAFVSRDPGLSSAPLLREAVLRRGLGPSLLGVG
jgi:ATP-dependent DNA helicase RecG